MRIGKLGSGELQEAVLSRISHRRKEVITGAAIGEDCASFSSDGLMLISSDPITGETQNIGSLAVKVAANDVWAGGGEPFLLMLTIIAPVTGTPRDIAAVMDDAEAEAKRQNIEIAGGHTEFSDAVNRMIVSCTAVGKANKHFMVASARQGDGIVVTKHIGLEGTALLAEAFYKELSLKLPQDMLAEALELSKQTGVGEESRIARNLNITSMHDITEGGVYGAVSELCERAGIGARIFTQSIPLLPCTKAICEALKVDPYRLLSSGSMLITTPEPQALIAEMGKQGIKATLIGEICSDKAVAINGDQMLVLDVRPDEYIRLTQS
jgi:hydrogenase expression/formation protein HypE